MWELGIAKKPLCMLWETKGQMQNEAVFSAWIDEKLNPSRLMADITLTSALNLQS